jgi:chaperonin GroES
VTTVVARRRTVTSGTTGKTIRTGAQGAGTPGVPSAIVSAEPVTDTGLPIRMLHDRVLVRQDGGEGERRSSAGIVIPATASVGRRLSWATAVGIGPNVRAIVVGDRVLFDPDDRSEVELHGREYVLLRERDVHAVAADRVQSDGTGLYL